MEILIRAIQVSQPIGQFYQAVMPYRTLVDISFVDIREMERDLDKYMGIQRKLDKTRVKKISQYVTSVDATFPTSIVIAVDRENIEWDEQKGLLRIFETAAIKFDRIAKILDGQHRVEGIKGFSDGEFDLPVTIFVGADLPTQANIFATVNLAQTKVNRSLVYDLFEYETSRSPQKSCHDIAVVLDKYPGSPLSMRIKRLGTATPGREKELLTQAVIVEALMEFISKEPWEDRNKVLKRLFASHYSNHKDRMKYIFRVMWLKEGEEKIVGILINYFKAVSIRWPKAWNDFTTQGNVLPKSNGFRALMRFLRDVYIIINPRFEVEFLIPSVDDFLDYFKKVRLEDDSFNIQTFPPGTSGESGLYRFLAETVSIQEKLDID